MSDSSRWKKIAGEEEVEKTTEEVEKTTTSTRDLVDFSKTNIPIFYLFNKKLFLFKLD